MVMSLRKKINLCQEYYKQTVSLTSFWSCLIANLWRILLFPVFWVPIVDIFYFYIFGICMVTSLFSFWSVFSRLKTSMLYHLPQKKCILLFVSSLVFAWRKAAFLMILWQWTVLHFSFLKYQLKSKLLTFLDPLAILFFKNNVLSS